MKQKSMFNSIPITVGFQNISFKKLVEEVDNYIQQEAKTNIFKLVRINNWSKEDMHYCILIYIRG